jgi:hypothetical protein
MTLSYIKTIQPKPVAKNGLTLGKFIFPNEINSAMENSAKKSVMSVMSVMKSLGNRPEWQKGDGNTNYMTLLTLMTLFKLYLCIACSKLFSPMAQTGPGFLTLLFLD